VIGSGQAGNPLCQKLSDHGWTVALIEKQHLGGTCVNTGCTPTKTMVASAGVAHYAQNASKWGVHTTGVRVDLHEVIARKDAIVSQWRSGLEKKVQQRPNLHLYRGQARFVGPHRVRVGEQELESERIFINTGTRTSIPSLEGLDRVDYLTNASIMELSELPEHLLVLGGGYIGLEFGQRFRPFGSRGTVGQRGGHLRPRGDADVTAELQKALEGEGIRFVLGARATRADRQGGQVVLEVQAGGAGETLQGSHLLVATGRRPNSDDLGLESAGVEVDAQGFIRV